MGYKPQRKVYRLNFSDTEYAGLEVTVRSPAIGELLELQALADKGDQLTRADVEALFAKFASFLVSWSVEDDAGEPVPATFAGVVTQEAGFIRMIMSAFQENVAGVPPPLPQASNGGGTPAEASLPMDTLSPSPAS